MIRKILIAVMAYGGDIPVAQMASIEQSVKLMAAEGWDAGISFQHGDENLPRARNAVASDFLASDCTDLVMIDADTVVSPEGLIDLLKIDTDVVGAPYRSRSDPLKWTSIRWLREDIRLDERGLIEVEGMGTGLLRVTRRALEMLWGSRPLFEFKIVDGNIWGEDLVFCQKWRALGGKCYLAPNIRTAHIGTKDYMGHLASWLATQPTDMRFDDAAAGTSTMVKNHLSKEKQRVFIAIPTYGGQLTVPTFLSIVRTIEELHKAGLLVHVECLSGDADLARCRNVLLGRFLQSSATDMLCIDADVSWGEGAALRLLSHNVDVVCGIYRMKVEDELYPVHWPQQRRMWTDPATNMPLLEADMVPAGFMRLSRKCVETLADASEKGWVTDKVFPDLKYPWIYDFVYDGKERRSEDYTFCRKWQAEGGTVWVDPMIPLDHTGIKTFQGNLMTYLAKEIAPSFTDMARKAMVDGNFLPTAAANSSR